MSENSGAVHPPLSSSAQSRESDRASVQPGWERDCPRAAELLVGQFANLHEGPLVFHRVVRLSDAAVPALERFVRGPSRAIYHPRSLGVDALAAIGTPLAVQALTRALGDSILRDLDPASLEAESVLVNHIAVHLSRFQSPEVTDALFAALRRRPYPYCAAALGLTGDPRAIPVLIECLFEDPARPAAAAVLQRFGREALQRLSVAALKPRMRSGSEPPTWVLGRAAAVKLIGQCIAAARSAALETLAKTLSDPEREIRWESALALARGHGPHVSQAAEVLISALDDPDWSRAQTTAEALAQLPESGARIAQVINAAARNETERRRRLRLVALAGKMGLADAVPGLRGLATAADPKLRLAAISALGQIESASAEAMARFLTDPEPVIRRRALQGLRGHHALTAESATAFLGDQDPDVRRFADASLCEDLNTARPALLHAVYHFGAPLRGFSARLRLWRYACALMMAQRRRAREPALAHGGRRAKPSPSDGFR